MIRDIVRIDRERCTGCGECISGCHEGALQLIDGKATLVSELMCDGLGACIGTCPEDAITIEQQEAEAYNETETLKGMLPNGKNVVKAHLQHLLDHNEKEYLHEAFDFLQKNKKEIQFNVDELIDSLKKTQQVSNLHVRSGCPGAGSFSFKPNSTEKQDTAQASALSHWPIQLHLINPNAAYFKGSNLLLAADCVAYTLANFHNNYLYNKTLTIACPKLDSNKESYISKIASLIDNAEIDTLTIMRMEVPCCGGLVQFAQLARQNAQRNIPIKVIEVSIKGEILNSKWI